MLISSESLFALYLGALGIESAVEAPLLAPGHYPFYGTGSWRVVRHDHVLSLVAYVTILLAVAVVLGVGAARAWNRLGDNLSSRWRSVDSAVTWSQPVVGVMVAIAVATLLDVHNPSPPPVDVWRSVIVYAVGIALGSVAVLHARRRTPGSPAAIARGVIGAVLLVTAGCSAFAVARVRFGGTVFSSATGNNFLASPVTPSIGVGPVLPDGDLANGFSTTVALPTGSAQPQLVSCASQALCTVFASQWTTTGFNIAMRYENGTWLASGIPVSPKVGDVTAYGASVLACVRPDICYLVDATGIAQRSDDGGRTWQTITAPVKETAPEVQLACPATNRCLYLDPDNGSLLVTTNAGRSWIERAQWPDVAGTGSTLGLACPTSSHCFELDTRVSGYHDGAVSLHTELRSSTDGGLKWESRAVAPLTGISRRSAGLPLPGVGFACSGASDCVSMGSLAGGTAVTTHDGGRVWELVRLPPAMANAGTISSVTCSSDVTCWAIPTTLGFLWRSDDGGATWTREALPPGIAIGSVPGPGYINANQMELGTMSCPRPQRCVALGTRTGRRTGRSLNVLLSTTNGGRTWVTATPPLAPKLYRPRPVLVG
jgi:hypothetical protein